jgi:hypothetical protein
MNQTDRMEFEILFFSLMVPERELEKQKTKPPKTHTIDLNTEQSEPSKKKTKFQTPFCQSDSSGTDNATNTSSKSGGTHVFLFFFSGSSVPFLNAQMFYFLLK